MTEKVGHISNPLTVIGIFAALAETAGSAVLPFLDKGIQQYYVWFLIGFPTLIVAAFFLTMNFNNRVLYSPSDFRDESNFMQLASTRISPAEKIRSIQREEVAAQPGQPAGTEGDRTDDEFQKKAASAIKSPAPVATVPPERSYYVEELVLSSIESEKRIDLMRNRVYKVGNQSLEFDGVGFGPNGALLVEVKNYENNNVNFRAIRRSLDRMNLFYSASLSPKGIGADICLAVVLNKKRPGFARMSALLTSYVKRYDMPVKLRIFDIEKLK